ncbi:MAG TPA: hypothetical protein VGC91_13335 [Pyrinomonadaceae bacterium]
MDAAYTTPPEVGRYQKTALIVGVVFVIVFLAGAFLNREQFFRSYLIGFIFWTGLALGSLGLLMLQYLTGGAWGTVIRRVLEAGTRTLPLMILLFLPLAALGLGHVYHWVHPETIADPEARTIVEHKLGYLNPGFFWIRAALYFALWGGLVYFLNKWSRENDRTADGRLLKNLSKLSGPGLVFFIFAVTFASFDWVMSLDAEWFSTIFGLLFLMNWVLTAFSFVIALMAVLSTRKPMSDVVAPAHFHDLGKLLLAFVMLWAYFSFSQYLIIWSGNIPEETRWYLYRLRGGWGYIALLVVLLHFALPFVMLLSRDLKRSARALMWIALLVFLMRLVDLLWLIVPVFHEGRIHFSWMDFVAPVAIGGIWLWYFAWELGKRPLFPFNDPQLEEAIERGKHEGH